MAELHQKIPGQPFLFKLGKTLLPRQACIDGRCIVQQLYDSCSGLIVVGLGVEPRPIIVLVKGGLNHVEAWNQYRGDCHVDFVLVHVITVFVRVFIVDTITEERTLVKLRSYEYGSTRTSARLRKVACWR